MAIDYLGVGISILIILMIIFIIIAKIQGDRVIDVMAQFLEFFKGK